MNVILIKCSKCNVEKDSTCFEKKRKQCKPCRNELKRQNDRKNIERTRQRKREEYHKHPEKYKAKVNEYRKNNQDVVKARKKKYYEENKEFVRAKNDEWKTNNVDRVRELARERWRERYDNDIEFKIKACLRARARNALNGRTKSAKTKELVGCDFDFLRDYIEAAFTPLMSWENYGDYWHIDHIRPCASFDLTDPEQQKICFHWSNLQPLPADENLRKGAKLDWEKEKEN